MKYQSNLNSITLPLLLATTGKKNSSANSGLVEHNVAGVLESMANQTNLNRPTKNISLFSLNGPVIPGDLILPLPSVKDTVMHPSSILNIEKTHSPILSELKTHMPDYPPLPQIDANISKVKMRNSELELVNELYKKRIDELKDIERSVRVEYTKYELENHTLKLTLNRALKFLITEKTSTHQESERDEIIDEIKNEIINPNVKIQVDNSPEESGVNYEEPAPKRLKVEF